VVDGEIVQDTAAVVDSMIVEDSATPPTGLRGEYFDGFDDPRIVRNDATVDFDWSKDAPMPMVAREWFSARWTGEISIATEETVTFETSSDDGVRLFIDDKPIIDNWTGHFTAVDKGTVALTAGWHKIRLDYFQFDIGATIQLFWSSPAIPRAIVPASALRPATMPSGLPPAPPYTNPVRANDCPDPGVLRVSDNEYYMACTGGPFTIFRSRDLVRWVDTGKSIIPSGKAPWSANGGRNWAPELHSVGGKYVAYFTAVNAADKLAIGVAYASEPSGPYTVTAAPLVDDPTPGVIDATFFRDDDGKQYLYWKRDGNQMGKATPIFVRQLSPDGLSFAAGSSATEVLTNDPASWEGGVVEAPWVVKHGSEYFMIYSGNVYDERYRTGVAKAPSPRGPFTKKGTPILVNNSKFLGPGHGSVIPTRGTDFFVYHAWINNGAGKPAAGGRQVLLDAIAWEGGWPKVANGSPSFTAQPYP
jgi:GH43 family beta-xylosidase